MSDKKFYIASTLSSSVEYAGYTESGNETPSISHSVTIAGGANVAGKHFITPSGVITAVSEEDAKFLAAHPLFQLHMKNGFITPLDSKPDDIDNVAADMTTRDESAPLVDNDYVDAGSNTATRVGANIKKK